MFTFSTKRALRSEVDDLHMQVLDIGEDVTRLTTHVVEYRKALNEVLYLAGAKPMGPRRDPRPDLTVIRGDGAR